MTPSVTISRSALDALLRTVALTRRGRNAHSYSCLCFVCMAVREATVAMEPPPFVPTGCDCDAVEGNHGSRCAIYVPKPVE